MSLPDYSHTEPVRIDSNNGYGELHPLVSICCLTYNHELYIGQAIESFLSQRTTFGVEILIHDDASTDGTARIIQEYEEQFPGIIRGICQTENQFAKGVHPDILLIGMAEGSYIALCEGDDYWTDPGKLEKQVRFLEKNTEYSACFGGYTRYDESNGEKVVRILNNGVSTDDGGFSFSLEEMKHSWLTKTLTAVFRKNAIADTDFNRYRHHRDIHLFYHVIRNGRAYYFRDNFGVYRMHPGGINSMNKGHVNANAAYNCYRELYLQNRDEFTRVMCFYSTVSLFNYNLYNRYPGNSASVNLRLFREAVRLSSSIREVRIILFSFLKREFKDYIKYHI